MAKTETIEDLCALDENALIRLFERVEYIIRKTKMLETIYSKIHEIANVACLSKLNVLKEIYATK